MKSAFVYDMHNYSATSSNNMPEPKLAVKAANLHSAKYSLRQRQKRKAVQSLADEYISDNSNDLEEQRVRTAKGKKCNSGQRVSRRGSGNGRAASPNLEFNSTAGGSKVKTKAAPLSKYRRKTANARERSRMREINSAFENLRQCVPVAITGEDTVCTNEKLTKITTLRLAMKYIRILDEALVNPSFEMDLLLECERAGDYRFIEGAALLQSPPAAPITKELPPAVEHAKQPKKSTTKCKNAAKSSASKNGGSKATTGLDMGSSNKATRKHATKRQTKRQKLQKVSDLCVEAVANSAYETFATTTTAAAASPVSTTSSLASSSSTSAYASLLSTADASSPHSSMISSSSYLLDSSVNSNCYNGALGPQSSNSDLSNLMLESDGDSLHLSDHCVSPMQSCNGGYSTLLGIDAVSGIINVGDIHAKTNTNAISDVDVDVATETVNTLAATQDATFGHYAAPANGDHLVLLENPFELNLSLLESSSADSFNFSTNQQPSACLSPLTTYTDAFNPFADLLHSDFPEHTALDLFST